MMDTEERDYFTVAEVAEQAGVHYRTVLSEIHAGRLHAYKVTPGVMRIAKAEADRYLRGEPVAGSEEQ